MQAAGVMPRTVMVFGQMDESPGVRFHVGFTALELRRIFAGHLQQGGVVSDGQHVPVCSGR